MRPLEQVVEDAKLEHDFECRRMDRVAAEIAEEIGVLLEHRDVDAGPGQQVSEHHPGRTAARDRTLDLHDAIVQKDAGREERIAAGWGPHEPTPRAITGTRARSRGVTREETRYCTRESWPRVNPPGFNVECRLK